MKTCPAALAAAAAALLVAPATAPADSADVMAVGMVRSFPRTVALR